VTKFLESDDPVAVQVRERLGERSLFEVAAELKKCLSLPDEDRIIAVKNVFAGGLSAVGNTRDSSNKNDARELLKLARSLLAKLAEILNES
jgi:23S rRNA C2498 (ribose-2'-O)-methylase RlmM